MKHTAIFSMIASAMAISEHSCAFAWGALIVSGLMATRELVKLIKTEEK